MALPTPVGRQHEVIYLPAAGHVVVLGTAGSGKTTVAILRSAYVANENLPHGGPTLLVTFNKALVTYMRRLAPKELAGVTVENYHTFARGYVHSRRPMRGRGAICDPRQRKRLIAEAVAAVREVEPGAAVLNRPTLFFEDEIHWLASHGYTDVDEYVAVERVGRAAAYLQRRQRPTVFRVYETYMELRRAAGKPYDWDDLAGAAVELLKEDDQPRMYRHIVVDEGQDLSPQMLRSLALAADPDEGSVTVFGDYAQQVYGTRMSWRDAGLNVKPSQVVRFQENYRNSRPIARLALAVSSMPYFRDVPDLVEPAAPKAEGPPPTVVKCRDAADELGFVVDFASQVAQRTTVAVLTRTREQERRLAGKLPEPKLRLDRDMNTWLSDTGIFYGTYHSAKGMEFGTVILPFCEDESLLDADEAEAFGVEEAQAQAGRLFYVGVTRARNELLMTYHGLKTSLLPAGDDLFTEVNR